MTCVEILYSVILLEYCKSPLEVTLIAMRLSSTVVDDGIFKRAVWLVCGLRRLVCGLRRLVCEPCGWL